MIGDENGGGVGRWEQVSVDYFCGDGGGLQGPLHPGHGYKVMKSTCSAVCAQYNWVCQRHRDEQDDGPEVGDGEKNEADQGELLVGEIGAGVGVGGGGAGVAQVGRRGGGGVGAGGENATAPNWAGAGGAQGEARRRVGEGA